MRSFIEEQKNKVIDYYSAYKRNKKINFYPYEITSGKLNCQRKILLLKNGIIPIDVLANNTAIGRADKKILVAEKLHDFHLSNYKGSKINTFDFGNSHFFEHNMHVIKNFNTVISSVVIDFPASSDDLIIQLLYSAQIIFSINSEIDDIDFLIQNYNNNNLALIKYSRKKEIEDNQWFNTIEVNLIYSSGHDRHNSNPSGVCVKVPKNLDTSFEYIIQDKPERIYECSYCEYKSNCKLERE